MHAEAVCFIQILVPLKFSLLTVCLRIPLMQRIHDAQAPFLLVDLSRLR